ncbi:MAG: nucleotidyltransferase family protein [Clostridia bacterium]|nr:nucleotidyltransferase family protein [Clostridia bacterium]
MEERINQVFFALLRSAICGTKLTEKEKKLYSCELFQDLIKLSAKHDLDHIVVFSLKQNELVSKENTGVDKCIHKAVFRYERTNFDYNKLCAIFEKAQIPFMPLKGSVIRKYYPEAWMRTSCDIDILMSEDDCDKAVSILENENGYVFHQKGVHDISLFSPNKTHIELHYKLVEEGRANSSSEVLENIWNTAKVREGFDFWYEMPDEVFYFYHIAHMAKHFENGGCGIKPFIDLLILDNIKEGDKNKRDKLLDQGKLLKFANVARKLSRIWFENEEYDIVSKQMEDYILRGGVYGNAANRVIIQQQQKGGRIKYALSKIFIPYDVIKFHYPVLQKHRWLTPVMEVRRWGKIIFCGHLKRTAKELKYNTDISDAEANNTRKFLDEIGL